MANLWQFAAEEAERQGVDPRLVAAVMQTESGGNPTARSKAGAYGPMQLMPATARDLGVDINDPEDNIRGGIKYLGQQLRTFGGDTSLATAAYNAGPGAVRKAGGVPRYAETQDYVRKIAARMGGVSAQAQQEPPMPKHGLDIDPSWLESADAPAATDPKTKVQQAKLNEQAMSGKPMTDIDPSWLEEAAPAATSPQRKVAAAQPQQGAAPQDSGNIIPASMAEGVNRMKEGLRSALPISYGKAEDGQSRIVMSPVVGGLVKGLAGIPALADRLGVKAARAIPESLGGNPNEQEMFATDLENAVSRHTAAPNSLADRAAGKAAEFVGGGVGGGKLVGGLGKLLPGAAGRVLTTAGKITPASVGGSITGGAAAQATDELVGKHLESPVARTALNLAAGVLGGAPGASVGQRLAGAPRNAEAAATLAAARSAGVPVQASDLSPTVAGLKQGIADKIPFGNLTAGKVPAQQVGKVQQELRSVAERYRPADLDPGAGTTGADRYLARDLRNGYRQAKAEANAAYAQVDDAMRANPELPPIDLAGTRAAVKAVQDEFPKTFRDLTLSKSAQRALGVLKGGTAKAEPLKTVKVGGVDVDLDANPAMRAALEAAGIKTTRDAPKVGLAEARTLASELHELANRASKSAVAGGGSQRQAGALKQLAGAVSDDVDNFMASAPPEIQQAYANADQVFRNRVLPYRADPKVRKLVSSKTPETEFDTEAQGLYQNLFNTAQGERSAMALQLMSDRGKQAAAYQALKEAGETALSNTGPAGLKAVSGGRKLDIEGNAALANIADNYPEFAQEAERLRGILSVGRSAAASEGRRNAATGIQNTRLITGGAMFPVAQTAGQLLGNAPLGYTAVMGAPIAGANAFNLFNRLGADAIARGGATGTERTAPGLMQGLLADDEPLNIEIVGGKREKKNKKK